MAFNKKLKIVLKLVIVFVLYLNIRYVNESNKSTNIADCKFFTKYVNLRAGWLDGTGDYLRQTLKSSCHKLATTHVDPVPKHPSPMLRYGVLYLLSRP